MPRKIIHQKLLKEGVAKICPVELPEKVLLLVTRYLLQLLGVGEPSSATGR